MVMVRGRWCKRDPHRLSILGSSAKGSFGHFLNWHWSMFGQTACPKSKRDVHLWGQKLQTTTTKHQHNNNNFECLYSMFTNHHICVAMLTSVCHIGGLNCSIFMHISKYTKSLVLGPSFMNLFVGTQKIVCWRGFPPQPHDKEMNWN